MGGKMSKRKGRVIPAVQSDTIPVTSNTHHTDDELQNEWTIQQDTVWLAAFKAYKWAIEMGIAKEQARAVLPEGMMESKLYMNGTIRSWIHYIQLRSANGTQKEHMEIAKACGEAIAKIFPYTFE